MREEKGRDGEGVVVERGGREGERERGARDNS